MEPLNKEDFDGWLALPQTQWFLKVWLARRIEGTKDSWAAAAFTTESQSGTIQLNAEAIARVQAWQQMMDITYEEIEGEFDNGGNHG